MKIKVAIELSKIGYLENQQASFSPLIVSGNEISTRDAQHLIDVLGKEQVR
jgi:hypothetical protein